MIKYYHKQISKPKSVLQREIQNFESQILFICRYLQYLKISNSTLICQSSTYKALFKNTKKKRL